LRLARVAPKIDMVDDWNFVQSYLCQDDNAASDMLMKNYKEW